eukprot:10548830-Heterocapsa_arctica.AAC.1
MLLPLPRFPIDIALASGTNSAALLEHRVHTMSLDFNTQLYLWLRAFWMGSFTQPTRSARSIVVRMAKRPRFVSSRNVTGTPPSSSSQCSSQLW